MIQNKVFALLISGEDKSFNTLRDMLKTQGIEVWSSQSCEEVARLLDQAHPELIFTATMLPDGTWRHVVRLSERVSVPTSVIVVGEHKDIRLYISAMDYGAFDFILPPFESDAISHVTRVAADSVRRRRGFRAFTAMA